MQSEPTYGVVRACSLLNKLWTSHSYFTERLRENTTLHQRAASVSPELQACQDLLSFAIEGVSAGNLQFRFTNIDKHDPGREFSLVLDVSDADYRGELSFVASS